MRCFLVSVIGTTLNTIRRVLNQATEAKGLPQYHPHLLRHACGTHIARSRRTAPGRSYVPGPCPALNRTDLHPGLSGPDDGNIPQSSPTCRRWRMKALTRKEAQKQLEFLLALEKLARVLDGKAKQPAKAQKAKAAAA